jgi:hypothetical protein
MILPNSKMASQPAPRFSLPSKDSEVEWEDGPGEVAWDLGVELKHHAMRVDSHETYEVLFSPWTPLHFATRGLAHHSWVGQWGVLENGERLKPPTTLFRPYRVVCPFLSSPQIAGEAPCPVCELLAGILEGFNWRRGLVGDWRKTLLDLLGVSYSYKLEVQLLSLSGKEVHEPIRFLTVQAPDAKEAFWDCYDEDFNGRIWTLTWTDHGLEITKSTSISKWKPHWGRVMPFHLTLDEPLQDLAKMAKASQGRLPHHMSRDRADQVKEWLGGRAVFVPLVWGLKRPAVSGFYKFAPRWMNQWDSYAQILNEGGIAFICGPASGNLCSLDLDLMSELEPVLRLNKWARGAMKVFGERGVGILFRLKGDYNARVHTLSMRDGVHVGELRLGNCLQTVSNLHPSGVFYRAEDEGCIPEIGIGDFVPPLHWDDLKPKEEKRCVRSRDGSACLLDLTKIKYMVDRGPVYDCQCPSCWSQKKDTAHDNLRIWKGSWGFKCIAGCSREDVLACVGKPDVRGDLEDDYDAED